MKNNLILSYSSELEHLYSQLNTVDPDTNYIFMNVKRNYPDRLRFLMLFPSINLILLTADFYNSFILKLITSYKKPVGILWLNHTIQSEKADKLIKKLPQAVHLTFDKQAQEQLMQLNISARQIRLLPSINDTVSTDALKEIHVTIQDIAVKEMKGMV